MALNPDPNLLVGSSAANNDATVLPIFNVEPIEWNFNIASDFVAGQVANNVLVLALATNRILRIDLLKPSDIDDVDLPKRSTEVGLISRMFLDPTASHLIISTTLGENFYLHGQSKQPKPLARLKGVSIECIAWNTSLPTASTREILIGAADGTIYEAYIEPASEFYRREERYVTNIWQNQGGAVTGLWVDTIPSQPDLRRVLVATQTKLFHWIGRTGGKGREGSAPIFADIFSRESPAIHSPEGASNTGPSLLAISPDPPEDGNRADAKIRSFAWLYSQGVLTGQLLDSHSSSGLGHKMFAEAKLHPRSLFPETLSSRGGRKLIQDPVQSATLTQWHALGFAEGRVVAINRLDGKVIQEQTVFDGGKSVLGLVSDQKKNTFWLLTPQKIFEIVAEDEERDVWKIMLQNKEFDVALKFAKGTTQKDVVAAASGDYLSSKGQFLEAAAIWGKSSKAFEEVCLNLIDSGQDDALRQYLLTKMSNYKKSSVMQRVMIASWLIQMFMAKLNSLDDMVATKAELMEHTDSNGAKTELQKIKQEYRDFITKYKTDLDAKTVYEIISSHDREDELLLFANTVTDYDYVLSYWVQREKWEDALNVLNKQSNPETFVRYSNVLMTHSPSGFVEILTRRQNIEPQKMIPALLSYNETASDVPLNQNHAIRYLNFVVKNYPEIPASVHNVLISIMASHPTSSESTLLSYLESQPSSPPPYDADFALRLCMQHHRVQSCVHIYTAMHQYQEAVTLALQANDIDLAALVADRLLDHPTTENKEHDKDAKLRKRLWLLIAEQKIKEDPQNIKPALDFLKARGALSTGTAGVTSDDTASAGLLRIQDLIPFFPTLTLIDSFKSEICAALESYSRHIASLKTEMDISQHTAEQITAEINALDSRYAIVEPGERCWICGLPVLARQFFVFPCQHAFHSDCLGRRVLENSGTTKRKNIKDLQEKVSRGMGVGPQRLKWIRELDGVVGEQCVLCGDLGIKSIDEPFIKEGEGEDWSL